MKTMFNVASKVLCENDGKFLILTRGPGFKEDVDDTPGGRIEAHEEVETGVLREIYEEAGINDVEDLQLFYSSKFDSKARGEFVMLYYHCYIKDASIILSDEHKAYRWVGYEDRESIEPWIKEVMEKWHAYKGTI